MKLTQRQILYRHLESLDGVWVQAFKLRGKETAFGFSGHQADRRLRELAAEGKIEHRINNGYAEYRVLRNRPQTIQRNLSPQELAEEINKNKAEDKQVKLIQ